jgi:hypothetical protein
MKIYFGPRKKSSPNASKRKRKSTEFDQQKAFVRLCRFYPKLRGHVLHIPNGGSRNIIEAKNLKLMGVMKGAWDIFVAIPSNKYGGMWIEFKSETGRLSKEQIEFEERMKDKYKCQVARTWQEAFKSVEDYLGDSFGSSSRWK